MLAGGKVKILSIPTINDDLDDFDRLFDIWKEAKGSRRKIHLDFSNCRFLRQNAVAFLGGLIRLVENRGGKVWFDWERMHAKVRRNLEKNGFRSAFQTFQGPSLGHSIPFREDIG